MSSLTTKINSSEINLSNFPPESFLRTLIESFPTEWQGFFGSLNATTPNSVQNAFLWYNEKQNSNRNCEDIPPNITILFEHLTRDFPVVFGNNLIFKPKFLLIPLHVQRNLMSFILSKSAISLIPLESLKLLDTKLNDLREDFQGWTSTFGKLLKIKIKELERDEESSFLGQQEKEVFYVNIITDQSKERFQGLCRQINQTPCSNNKGVITSKILWKSLENDGQDSVTENETALCPEEAIPIDTGMVGEEKGNFAQEVEMIDVDLAENCQTDLSSQKIIENQMSMSVSLAKKAKIEEPDGNKSSQLVIPPPPPQEIEVTDDEQPDISEDLQLKLVPLKNLVQTLNESSEADKATSCIVALNVFCELSSSELEYACKVINLEHSNEQTVTSLCQYFVALKSEPSYMHACAFASYCILPHLRKLEQAASRVLTAAVSSFSKKHPKAVCEGLFIKLLNYSCFSTFQADVISRTLKDMPNQDISCHLFSLILKAPNLSDNKFFWSEDTISVVQTIIDRKLVLDNDSFKDYMNALQENSATMVKSLKFAKLLLATINNYCIQVVAHRELIENILQKNETFLKKAGLASLRKALAKVQT